MASTLNLQSTLKWAGAFLSYQPLTIGGQEPAVSIANIIQQTILGPPFCWPWNRATATFTCAAGTQDYSQALSDFGFIEKAWLKAAGSGTDIKELNIKNCLSASSESGRPQFVAQQNDDGAGNITFRVMNNPDAAYVVNVLYQKKPQFLTSIGSLWAPIPDECAYIFNWGFLAIAAIIAEDEKFPIYNNRFLSHLLGRQDGLDDIARNLFLSNWEAVKKTKKRNQLKTQHAVAG